MTECPSHLMLAQYHCDELDGETRQKIAGHLHDCDRCTSSLSTLRQNAATYELNISTHAGALRESLAAETPHNAEVLSFPARRKTMIAVGFAAAAAIMVLSGIVFWQPKSETPSDISFKGAFSFTAVVKRDNRQFNISMAPELQAPELQENDAIRFMIQTGHRGFVYIFNVDHKGAITSLYPFDDAGRSMPALSLQRPGAHTLDGSIVLDNSKGREYFVAIFSESPFDTGVINAPLAKALISDNKENGDTQASTTDRLPGALKDAVVRVIAFTKK
ncbi:MAG: DUF4384 domain-containing protein [Deltaproteobacteria bacterium]|nr:DUF4384 domain-containing protein [Deltaproteobacteria bacterium]